MAGSHLLTQLKQQALRVSLHEAGHYVLAARLGFVVGGMQVMVIDDASHSGSSEVTPATTLVDLDAVKDYLQRRIQVLKAGAYAEALSGGKVDIPLSISYAKLGADNDWAKWRELSQLLRSMRYAASSDEAELQAQLNELDTQLSEQTITLVEAQSSCIETVAHALAKKVVSRRQWYSLTKAEAEEALARCPAPTALSSL